MELGKWALTSLGISILSAILHNVIYGLFGFEEPLFFILTFIFAFGFITLGGYWIFMYIFNKLK